MRIFKVLNRFDVISVLLVLSLFAAIAPMTAQAGTYYSCQLNRAKIYFHSGSGPRQFVIRESWDCQQQDDGFASQGGNRDVLGGSKGSISPVPQNEQTLGNGVDQNVGAETCHPVDIATGTKRYYEEDFVIPPVNRPLMVNRIYDKSSDYSGLFGSKWSSTLDYTLSFEFIGGGEV